MSRLSTDTIVHTGGRRSLSVSNVDTIESDMMEPGRIKERTRNAYDAAIKALNDVKCKKSTMKDVLTKSLNDMNFIIQCLLKCRNSERGESDAVDSKLCQIQTRVEDIASSILLLKQTSTDKNETQESPKGGSYASALKSNFAKDISTHDLIIKANDNTKTSDEIEGLVKKNINPKQLGIGISSIKKTSKNSVIIKTESKKDCDILKSHAGKINELLVEERSKKNPLIVFKGVIKGMTAEELNEAIAMQNKKIKIDEKLVIKYRRRHRNNLLANMVCQVKPETWKALTETGKVYIGYQNIYVEDESPMVQCYKCLGFGHVQKFCGNSAKCAHCSGEHYTRECKENHDLKKCANCQVRGKDSSHSAFSQQCNTRMHYDRLAREATNYTCVHC